MVIIVPVTVNFKILLTIIKQCRFVKNATGFMKNAFLLDKSSCLINETPVSVKCEGKGEMRGGREKWERPQNGGNTVPRITFRRIKLFERKLLSGR